MPLDGFLGQQNKESRKNDENCFIYLVLFQDKLFIGNLIYKMLKNLMVDDH